LPGQPLLDAFEVLYEAEGLPSYLLPFDLERIYGGIGFQDGQVYSNFVTSIDGVATLGDGRSAGSVISAHNAGDRFLMSLLRACADAVLIGSGTLRATPGHLWTAGHVSPQFADSFAALRRSLGRTPEPRLVVITAHGTVDASHPAVKAGATFVTTAPAAKKLEGSLPPTCDVIVAGEGDGVDVPGALDALRGRGYNVILTEGGPTVMGHLIRAGVLDEAFLTVSPVVAGRNGEERMGMVEGVELLPAAGVWSRLLSARRHGDYLFLRYGLRATA
jgi:riboflavin biosynthesis pyrimidine reductase